MNTEANNGRKVAIMVLATLLLALAVFAGVSANRATVDDAYASGGQKQCMPELC